MATTTKPDVFTSRAQALKAGSPRYFGKICDKHPELKGERRVGGRACVKCYGDRQKRRRQQLRANAPRENWIITLKCSEPVIKGIIAELKARANLKGVKATKLKQK